MNVGTCRGCGATIAWIKLTESGKLHPVDLPPALVRVENGSVPVSMGNVVARFVSHFATCPKANDFRRGKK